MLKHLVLTSGTYSNPCMISYIPLLPHYRMLLHMPSLMAWLVKKHSVSVICHSGCMVTYCPMFRDSVSVRPGSKHGVIYNRLWLYFITLGVCTVIL